MDWKKKLISKVHKLSDKNKEDRLYYCQKYKNENFNKVIFSDEVCFELTGKRVKIWTKLDEEF